VTVTIAEVWIKTGASSPRSTPRRKLRPCSTATGHVRSRDRRQSRVGVFRALPATAHRHEPASNGRNSYCV